MAETGGVPLNASPVRRWAGVFGHRPFAFSISMGIKNVLDDLLSSNYSGSIFVREVSCNSNQGGLMKDTYLNKAITIFTAFLALSLCLLFTDAHASASEVDPSQATWVDPQVLRGEESSPLTSYGYEVFYSQQNASTFSANNIQTQCISSHMHTTWYGLSARQCKAADATGASFTIFNAATGKAVAKVDLKKVPLPPIGKSVPLGCVVSTVGFILTIPGMPTNTVGWALKGANLLINAAGIKLSC